MGNCNKSKTKNRIKLDKTKQIQKGPLTNDYTYLFKVVLIGDSGSGKSSVLLRFADNTFLESMMSTIGVDFKIQTLKIGPENVKLQIWDTAGQEKFKTITSTYYRGSNGVVLVFDVTNEESFLNIQKWLSDVDKATDKSVFKILVGNKADMIDTRKVSQSQAEAYSQAMGIPYIETSAKEGTNIQATFEQLAVGMMKNVTLLQCS